MKDQANQQSYATNSSNGNDVNASAKKPDLNKVGEYIDFEDVK